MALPTIILTGASGFVGRHLLEALAEDYRIFGIARRSQHRCGAPVHPNITWFQVDIGEREPLGEVFRMIKVLGGAETVVHLAAHYDFTGDEHPEYQRTNVDGLRNTLDFSRELGVKRFVFSSSVAACRLPAPGSALTESSPPDGDHIYARTKRIGEAMVQEYADAFPSTIVRFAALFSDWCEYPPLFMFLSTWLSPAWNRNVLGGRGESAIPYLHVKDVVAALRLVLEKRPGDLAPGEVLIASPDGSTSHRELFAEATRHFDGAERQPVLMPRPLCGPGMWARELLGKVTGDLPFERPWMAEYIDLKMTIDASRTRARLGFSPRPRLEVLRRLPFLIENLKTDPLEWNTRNRAAMKAVQFPSNLRLHRLLEKYEDDVISAYHGHLVGPHGPIRFANYQRISEEEHDWNHRVVFGHLKNAVRTREKGVLISYCRQLATRRFEQGFEADELCGALLVLNLVVHRVVRRDPEAKQMRQELLDYVTSPLRLGCDEIQEVFDELSAARSRAERAAAARAEADED
ncbi:MAG: NAD(P)-dependent oxidoreductase [Thermoanaerobaculia bacterium]